MGILIYNKTYWFSWKFIRMEQNSWKFKKKINLVCVSMES